MACGKENKKGEKNKMNGEQEYNEFVEWCRESPERKYLLKAYREKNE